jgi:hypothetical protein
VADRPSCAQGGINRLDDNDPIRGSPVTLVIAAIHDNQITIVSDSKITYDNDESRTRRELLRSPALKLLIISPTIAVGLAGSLPADTRPLYQAIHHSPDDPERTVATLRDRSAQFPEFFLVAALVPEPSLTRIRRGTAVSSDRNGRCVVGDQESYELYLAREQHCKDPRSADVDEAEALRMAIQYFVNVDNGPTTRSAPDRETIRAFLGTDEGDFDRTIGGYLTEIVTTPSGFRYEPHTQLILPDRLRYRIQRAECGQVRLLAETKDLTLHQRYTLIGGPPNRRAIGFCLPESGTGVFYPDGEPWSPTLFSDLSSADEMARAVWEKHRQILLYLSQSDYIFGQFFPG